MKKNLITCGVITVLLSFNSIEVKAQYPANCNVRQVQYPVTKTRPRYQTFEEAKRQSQHRRYGGYKVDNNNYVIQTTPTQDYKKNTSVNGQTLETMGGSTSSSSTKTNRSVDERRFKKDSKAEIDAQRSAVRNPTGAGQSKAHSYTRNNNVKYGSR